MVQFFEGPVRLSNLFWAVLFVSSVVVSLLGQADVVRGQQLEKHQALAKFQKDLAKRVVKEQGTRIALDKFHQRIAKAGAESNDAKDKKEYFRLAKRASDVDEDNLKWLKKQIAEYGFPEPSQIGQRSAEQFFLLIVHADRDREFQKDCIRRLKESSQWPEQPEWSRLLKKLEKRASLPSSGEYFRIGDPKKKPKVIEAELLDQE